MVEFDYNTAINCCDSKEYQNAHDILRPCDKTSSNSEGV